MGQHYIVLPSNMANIAECAVKGMIRNRYATLALAEKAAADKSANLGQPFYVYNLTSGMDCSPKRIEVA